MGQMHDASTGAPGRKWNFISAARTYYSRLTGVYVRASRKKSKPASVGARASVGAGWEMRRKIFCHGVGGGGVPTVEQGGRAEEEVRGGRQIS